jgi:hypothetical protein
MVSTKWARAKWISYEHLLVIEGTNKKQVHHFKKENNGNLSREV